MLSEIAIEAGVMRYRFDFRKTRDEVFAESVQRSPPRDRSTRQSLANHPTQATEGPADVRNLFYEKQRLPGPIYPDSSHRYIASKRHFLQ